MILIAENRMIENYVADFINEIFPQDYIYMVIKCDELDISPGGLKFEIELRVIISDKESVNPW